MKDTDNQEKGTTAERPSLPAILEQLQMAEASLWKIVFNVSSAGYGEACKDEQRDLQEGLIPGIAQRTEAILAGLSRLDVLLGDAGLLG